MSHIFGLPHNFGDFLPTIPSFFGPDIPPTTMPTVIPPGSGPGRVVQGTNPCARPAYQIVTTVNPDGTTKTVAKCKTRRRRRRLASMSDIKDLAALKSILGGGKAFDTWIATRGR